jgi:hypothetical protein
MRRRGMWGRRWWRRRGGRCRGRSWKNWSNPLPGLIALAALRRQLALAEAGAPWHFFWMSTVQQIKAAINRLSIEERAELTAALCGWTDDDWDSQMKSDADGGKFASLNREANSAHSAGQTIPLDDTLNEP